MGRQQIVLFLSNFSQKLGLINYRISIHDTPENRMTGLILLLTILRNLLIFYNEHLKAG